MKVRGVFKMRKSKAQSTLEYAIVASAIIIGVAIGSQKIKQATTKCINAAATVIKTGG